MTELTTSRGLRITGLLALLAAEAVALSLRFDASALGRAQGLVAASAAHAGLALQLAITCAAALAIVFSTELPLLAAELADSALPRLMPALLGNLLSFLLFAWLTAAAFEALAQQRAPGLPWFLAWLGSALACAMALAPAVAPWRFWRSLLRTHSSRIVLGFAGGCALWGGGHLAQLCWGPLADFTLNASGRLLRLIYPEVQVLPERVIRTADFAVLVAPECSGYEGIGLVLAAVMVYLWIFRAQLRFPRALLLFPVGVAGSLLVNVLRIAALVVVGSEISPAVAQQGFHSQSGWIGFSLVALGLLMLSHRFLLRPSAAAGVLAPDVRAITAQPAGAEVARLQPGADPATSAALAPALLLPLVLQCAGAMLAAAAMRDGFSVLAPAAGLGAALALVRYRKVYQSQAIALASWPDAVALLIGVLVFVGWLALSPPAASAGAALQDGLARLPALAAGVWLVLRTLGSVLLVPLAEELAFRGYLLPKLVAADFAQVPRQTVTPLSFVVSSCAFGLLHQNWPAGILAGALFALALYRRGRLVDAVAAHVTANLLIAAMVLLNGRWDLWS